MPLFKAAVTLADRLKNRGDWIIKPAPPEPPAVVTGKCRLFELPGELRNRIWDFVFAPGTIIELRKELNQWKRVDTRKRPKAYRKQDIRCGRRMNKHSRGALRIPKWSSSILGIVLVNKQAHAETEKLLYRTSEFVFESVKLARPLLQTVQTSNLESVREICIRHEYYAHGSSVEAVRMKKKAEASFMDFCRQLVRCLPNIDSIHLQLRVNDGLAAFVPEFHMPEITYGVRSLNRMGWVQPLKTFTDFQKLRHITVDLPLPRNGFLAEAFENVYYDMLEPNMEALLAAQKVVGWGDCVQITDADMRRVMLQRWNYWVTILFEGMARATMCLIRGYNCEKVWTAQVKLLEGYRMWRRKPVGLEGYYDKMDRLLSNDADVEWETEDEDDV